MADFRAIAAACQCVTDLLRATYSPGLIEGDIEPDFEVYGADNFAPHMDSGISLFVYRVTPNTNQRSPMARDREAPVYRPVLPLDIHFLITAWASDMFTQHSLLGWAMRVLEDYPVLPASLLNSQTEGVFDSHETLELVTGSVTDEEMFRIWQGIGEPYTLSAPYIARVVRIRSLLDPAEGEPVIRRDIGVGKVSTG